jgi:8-oxo-dGTP diphosphatase
MDVVGGSFVAAVWLCTRGGRILAVRPHGVSAYFLPGGLPEPGETLAQATAREVLEEVAVPVDPAALVETVRIQDEAYGRPGMRVETRLL